MNKNGTMGKPPKNHTAEQEKNLISSRLKELRKQHHLSQRALAARMQLEGYDVDKNVITRIETNKRHVKDLELVAFTHIFKISVDDLLPTETREDDRQD